MYRRLVAFGCSFTYGHGLPDCHLPPGKPGPNPSKHAWPAKVAKILGRNCVNLARPGASCKQVAKIILDTEFHKDDIVCIWWPHVSRSTYFTDDGRIVQLGPWPAQKVDAQGVDIKLLKHWHFKLAHVGEKDGHIERAMWITFVNSYLQSKVKLVTNYIHDREDSVEQLASCAIQPVPLPDSIVRMDMALDDAHPGLKSHTAISQLVNNDVVEKLESCK